MKTWLLIIMALVAFLLLSTIGKPAEFKKMVGLLGRLVQRRFDLFFIVINKNLKELFEEDIERKISEKKGGDED